MFPYFIIADPLSFKRKNNLPLETAGKNRKVPILPFQQLDNMEWPPSDLENLQMSNPESNKLST